MGDGAEPQIEACRLDLAFGHIVGRYDETAGTDFTLENVRGQDSGRVFAVAADVIHALAEQGFVARSHSSHSRSSRPIRRRSHYSRDRGGPDTSAKFIHISVCRN